MGVSTLMMSPLLVSLVWILHVSAQVENPQPPSVEIGIEIIKHSKKNESTEETGSILLENQEFLVLVDTWWKILAWSIAVLILSCLCCYFSRCCYLCYDCCSDPFWGCCPQSRCCIASCS